MFPEGIGEELEQGEDSCGSRCGRLCAGGGCAGEEEVEETEAYGVACCVESMGLS